MTEKGENVGVNRHIAGIVAFLTSAAVLVMEIVASRLLAPYVGVTLQTYTAIIGVVLAGISLGAWFGGRLADRGNPAYFVEVKAAIESAGLSDNFRLLGMLPYEHIAPLACASVGMEKPTLAQSATKARSRFTKSAKFFRGADRPLTRPPDTPARGWSELRRQ